jgi:hypothetical protein
MRIHRSSRFFKHLFKDNDIAYYIDGEPVTFSEIKKKKVIKQKEHLQNIRANDFWIKPCFIWAFHNKTFFFGGWWLYVKCNNIDFAVNFKNDYDFPRLIQ